MQKGESTREHILEQAESLVLDKGFSGTSLDDILKSTGLTKGAFFYHFKSKADLARALVERYARTDMEMFKDFARRAEELSDDPLQSMYIFLKLFEEFVEQHAEPLQGCVFASYIYESQQFDMDIRSFIREGFREWSGHYEEKFQKVMDKYPARLEVTARELAEMMMCVIEGAFILQRSYNDPMVMAQQLKLFRRFLKLVFED